MARSRVFALMLIIIIIMLQPLAIRVCGASTQYHLQGKPCLPDKNHCSDPSVAKCVVSVSDAARC